MAASNATTVPVYNQAFRIQFPMYLSTGALNTSPGTIACTLVKDGVAAVASTNAVAEVSTNGVYTLDLTAAEMSYNSLTIIVTSTTSSAVTYTTTLNPVQAGYIPADVNSIRGSAANAIALAASTGAMVVGTVVTSTYSPTVSDFETSLTGTPVGSFVGRTLYWAAGSTNVGAGEPVIIAQYTVTNSKGHLWLSASPVAPVSGDTFVIV